MRKDPIDMTIEELVDHRELIDAYLVRAITEARKGGFTWRAIGVSLGVSPQQAHQKYAWVEKTIPKLPEPTTGP